MRRSSTRARYRGISAPMMVIGSVERSSTETLTHRRGARLVVVFNAQTQVASNPKVSLPGAAIDIIANVGPEYADAACVFASPVRASAPWLVAAAGYAVSSAVVRWRCLLLAQAAFPSSRGRS